MFSTISPWNLAQDIDTIYRGVEGSISRYPMDSPLLSRAPVTGWGHRCPFRPIKRLNLGRSFVRLKAQGPTVDLTRLTSDFLLYLP